MSHHPLHVSIIYAPSPDEPIVSADQEEDCAAYQYASRAKEFLLTATVDKAVNVTISRIQESSFEDASTCQDPNILDVDNPKKMLLVLLMSCSADGSIHRLLRKATKRLTQQDSNDGSSSSRIIQSVPLAVVLLGHARCDNSAKQMKDTIFGSGRRIEKALLNTNNSPFASIQQDRLETQVELVGPEVDFDPWWSLVIEQCWT
ncbi:unnamed protein product [Cylindrotheca closterium]|uniref:Uncharacterized protein n=1 Tax=Cylindrotheca closterium TaxID=2856 RepID=A0AAD2FRH1_9STRA|nr:unnamed protein product [Cylindrotheca closterium]